MLQLRNKTKFEAALIPMWDKERDEVALLVMKATFRLSPDQVTVADEQVPVLFSDEWTGQPGESSLLYEADLALIKHHADVIVNGTAYSPGAVPVTRMTVRACVGPIKRELVVIGDRVWSAAGLGASSPEPFTQMPVSYDRAFGGRDASESGNATEVYRQNPAGRGFYRRLSCVGLPLPNVEMPGQEIRGPRDRPPPAGFGFIAKHWEPRVHFAGTYGEAWQAVDMPFLPSDFDVRFFQGASPGMTMPYPVGGESVFLENLTREGRLTFSLPNLDIPVVYHHAKKRAEAQLVADTIVIEPDASRLVVTLRTRIPCFGDALRLREVVVGDMTVAERRAHLTGKRYWDKL